MKQLGPLPPFLFPGNGPSQSWIGQKKQILGWVLVILLPKPAGVLLVQFPGLDLTLRSHLDIFL